MGFFKRKLSRKNRSAMKKAAGNRSRSNNGKGPVVRDAEYWGVAAGTPISEAKKIRAAKGLSSMPKKVEGSAKSDSQPTGKSGSRRGGSTRPSNSPTSKGTADMAKKASGEPKYKERLDVEAEAWKRRQAFERENGRPPSQAERRKIEREVIKEANPEIERHNREQDERLNRVPIGSGREKADQSRSDRAAKARQDRREMKSEAEAKREAKSGSQGERPSKILRPGHPDARTGPLSGNNTEQGRANNIEAELNKEFRKANGRGPSTHERANIRRQAEHLARQGYTG